MLSAQSVQVYQLQNGMQVAYVQDTTRRLMHIGLTLRGGSSVNPEDKAGFAHFFEHHFFGGIDSAAGSPTGVLRQVGMISTAASYPEHQTFTISMPAARQQEGMAALASSLRSALERDPIKTRILADIAVELQANESLPTHYLKEEIRNRLWKKSAATQDVAGRYSHIQAIDLALIQQVLTPYLHPGNCLLSATGPSSADAFFHVADSLLGDWRPNSAGAGLPNIQAPALKETVYFVEENEFCGRPLMIMAWPVPGARTDADNLKMAHSFAAVARMHGSAFHRQLTETGRAEALWWEYEGGYNPSQIVLRMVPKPDSLQACIRGVQTAIWEISQQAKALGSKEVINAAEKQAALEAALGWDRSATRLDMLGRRWAAMEPSWANVMPLPIPSMDALQAFVKNHLLDKPHVAGVLVNPQWATLAEATFQPVEADPQPVAVAPKDPVVANPTVLVSRPDPIKDDSVPVVAAIVEVPPLEKFKAALKPIRILFTGMTLQPDAASFKQIEQVATYCQANPEQKLYLNGYSDGEGDGVTNYHLSIKRAQAVQKILAERYGIKEDRLIINPFGEAFPEFPDNTPEQRHKNRRVTFDFAPSDAQPRFFIF